MFCFSVDILSVMVAFETFQPQESIIHVNKFTKRYHATSPVTQSVLNIQVRLLNDEGKLYIMAWLWQ